MSLISRLFQAPVNFVEHKVDEVRGEVRTELADGLASVSVYAMLAGVGMFCALFFSTAIALAIGLWTGSYAIGFGVVGVVYLIIVVYIWRLTKNEEFMEKLRLRFHRWMKVPVKEQKRRNMESAPFENDI
ncbi:phage holin family protein [Fulvivirga sedimenti]|jgi:hypothetical protein|uniref:Phage holin family protein n=1 Tax=Fulvivirga sedimenti TaxID=2879465 RepID=A0A9X1HZ38_9BACT|nr:phage holin family protein [Fulvivirga sedimenti]MCA6079252.1 phage holin family protein [Fulvivirga sedimenti]